MAGSFGSHVDKEMTTLTASIHKDNWDKFLDIVLPQLVEPGFRDDDFQRLKDAQLNALKESLRNNNEEELGKEELQNRIYAGTPYGHTPLGTVAVSGPQSRKSAVVPDASISISLPAPTAGSCRRANSRPANPSRTARAA